MLVAVLLTATKWGRAWPVWSGSFGALLGRLLNILLHMPLHLTLFGELRNPTSHAVWGISNPYISRCVANAPVCLPFIFPFSLLSSLQQFHVVLFSLFMFHFVTCLMMFGTKAAIVEWIFLFRPHRVFLHTE